MILTQAIERNALVSGNQTSTIFEGRKRTWKETKTRIAKLAAALQEIGVTPGDRVAMLSLNSDRYVEFYYAVAWAGAVMVPLNTRWSIKENQYSLEDSGSVCLFVDDTYKHMAESLKEGCSTLNTFIYTGEEQTPEGMFNYETLIDTHTEVAPFPAKIDDMVGIFYTGGTTGFPKGVMLSHKTLWVSNMSLLAELFDSRRQSKFLVAGPMFHLAAASVCWSGVIGSAQLPIIAAFDTKKVLKIVEEEQVTETLLVPTMINMLIADEERFNYDLSSLKTIVYGASPMPEGTLLEAMDNLPNVGFVQAYGQTELSPVCSILPAKYHVLEGENAGKLRSAGRPSYSVTVSIQDDNGNILEPNQVGEICCRAENVMMGYWNKPEQTEQAMANGWLHTGDAGYLDEDGFIFLVDRVKDMIVSGGENIFSAEVESALSKHPNVHEIAVIGIPSEQWGETVHAIIRPKPGKEIVQEEIIAFCREYIAGYKVPRSIECREEPFPITGAGKIQKNELRDPFWKDNDRRIN